MSLQQGGLRLGFSKIVSPNRQTDAADQAFSSLLVWRDLAQAGSYIRTDGSTAQMADLALAADHLFSRHSEAVELTEEYRQAPNLQGMGRLRDLREAAALSGSLLAVLAAYTEAVNDDVWEWGFKVA